MSLQEEMIQKELFEARMETELEDTAKRIYSKGLKELNNNEAYYVLLSFVKDYARVTEEITGEKKIYYILVNKIAFLNNPICCKIKHNF